jgi:hypothetical protein
MTEILKKHCLAAVRKYVHLTSQVIMTSMDVMQYFVS